MDAEWVEDCELVELESLINQPVTTLNQASGSSLHASVPTMDKAPLISSGLGDESVIDRENLLAPSAKNCLVHAFSRAEIAKFARASLGQLLSKFLTRRADLAATTQSE